MSQNLYFIAFRLDEGEREETNITSTYPAAQKPLANVHPLQLIFFKANDTKKKLSFSNSQCPRQTNNVDCGYYVMKFMKDIITHRQLMISTKYFEDCQFNSYDGEQLHEVKDEWAAYVFNNFFW
ncbi:uncharacterized protein LOC130738749 [Lotus japonicus]|uniref:uncharacterized protein LOC130738749 n=1 Tax=Lotus japonicus TaxID=34305 RepID=UPI002586921C|nr:uncharacterized protein LOC130738749 [Lotus japonicus]